jgi:hypothetical protein
MKTHIDIQKTSVGTFILCVTQYYEKNSINLLDRAYTKHLVELAEYKTKEEAEQVVNLIQQTIKISNPAKIFI